MTTAHNNSGRNTSQRTRMGCGGSKNQPNDPRSCFPLPVLKSPSDLISILPSLSIPPLNLQDYEILTPLASGGIGIVYSAQHKETKQYIALKFFGYVPKRVNLMELYHEFELFAAVNGFDGVVQLLGFGIDTPSGYIRNKVSKLSYPVICMEYLQGGDLFDRIQSRSRISEHDIALIFRNLIVSLIGLHKRGYIHCDIKLENIMFATSQANDFNVKFIDFGMMIQLPNGRSVYTSSTIHGTPGYVAPESLRYGQYSFQSDVWQVGCVLYSLLSGFQAFNPSHPEQIILGKYQKMTGIGWDNISNEAKDLLSKIFVLNPNKRLTCEEILTHPWLHAGIAPRADLGEHYHKRIKHLALGQTLKKVFQNRDMVQVTSDTKEKLKRILPLLLREKKKIRRTRSSNMASRPSLSSLLRSSSPLHPPLASPRPLPIPRTLPQPLPRQIDEAIISFNKKHSTPSIFVHASPSPLAPVITQHYEQERQLRAYAQDDIDLLLMARRRAQAEDENEITTTTTAVASSEHQAWKAKMALLKTAFVHHASGSAHGQRTSLRSSGCRSSPPDDQTSIGEDGSAMAEEQSIGRHSGNGNGSGGEINFEAFVSLLLECDLSELATPQMFHIFDTNKTGTIDLKDFLVTMIAFRDTTEPQPPPSLSPTVSPAAAVEVSAGEENEEMVRFYFNMFDFDCSGAIGLDELKLIIRCICTDHDQQLTSPAAPATVEESDVEAMFTAMATKNNDSIDYEEFKSFYLSLLLSSSSSARPPLLPPGH